MVSWLQSMWQQLTDLVGDYIARTLYTQTTAGYRVTFEPNQTYDLSGNVLAVTDYYAPVSIIPVATGKQNDLIRFDYSATLTGTARFDAINTNAAYTTQAGANGYGYVATLTDAGAGAAKAIYGRADAAGGNTGTLAGLVGAVTPIAGTTNAYCAQLSYDGTLITNSYMTLWQTNNASTVANGLVANGLLFNNAFIQWNQTATQTTTVPFLRQFNSGATNVWQVDALGNVAFGTTGQRITADFSNATHANRLLFQDKTAANASTVGVIPGTTGTIAQFAAYAQPDPDNTNRVTMQATTTGVIFNSTKSGSGTTQDMAFQIASVTAATIYAADKGMTCLNLGHAVVSKSADYTAVRTDHVILVNATAANRTITLPAANAYGAGFSPALRVKRIDSSANTVTVQRGGADTLDGGTTTTLAALAAKDFESDGVSAWYIC